MRNDVLIRKYEAALKIALNESHVVWQFSQAFLVTNAIILGFVSQSETGLENNLSIFLLSIFGFIINILWMLANQRRWDWFKFRMAQAREAEPNDWNLIKGSGKDFSDGKAIIIGDECYQLNTLGRARTHFVTTVFIFLFMAIYFFLIYISNPIFIISLYLRSR